jgi:hypothetical protein
MMAGRQVGGAHHRKRRSHQHCTGIDACPQFRQCAIHDLGGWCRLDELDQGFYGFGILDSGVHSGLLDNALRAKLLADRLALPGLTQRLPGTGNTRISAIS